MSSVSQPSIDADLTRHCLEDLTGRSCPIIKQRAAAKTESDACEGLSIRDTLFNFAVEAIIERQTAKPKRRRELKGQITALTYAVALIDNPYRVDTGYVEVQLRVEVESRFDH